MLEKKYTEREKKCRLEYDTNKLAGDTNYRTRNINIF